LSKQQDHIANKAEILVRAFARVGIIALVDEATGYQRVRARDELQKILAAYISPELLPWAKRFPDYFYEELHRVRGWKYKPGSLAKLSLSSSSQQLNELPDASCIFSKENAGDK
jgi:hypothetical protein